MTTFKCKKLINESYAYDNILNHNKDDFSGQSKIFIRFKDGPIYPSIACKDMDKGAIGLPWVVRNKLSLGINESIIINEHKKTCPNNDPN